LVCEHATQTKVFATNKSTRKKGDFEMRKTFFLFLFLCFGSLAAAQSAKVTPTPAAAQPTKQIIVIPDNQTKTNSKQTIQSVGEDEVIKVETQLVTIPVSVFDRQGRFVTDLRKQDFQILENGKPQEIAYFAASESPVTVALMIDVSDSTKFNIEQIQDSAIAFIRQLKPNDVVMVVSFDKKVRVLSEPTTNRNQLFDAVRRAKHRDGTSIYEAVDLVLNQRFKKVEGRKAAVLFTDGVDTTSRRRIAGFESTLAAAEEADVTFFAVWYDTYDPRLDNGETGYGFTRQEYEVGANYLENLTTKTGGRIFRADAGNLEKTFANVAEELRWQYNVGYYPPDAGKTGERRQLKVKVARPNLAVRARDSYVVGAVSK
jgi:Ca-activated chloride channel family protein